MTAPMDEAEDEAERAAAEARFARNSDGSIVYTLEHPVTWKGEQTDRVTIPALRGKHMFSAPNLTEGTPFGDIVKWAHDVVQPVGIVGEMMPLDAIRVSNEVLDALGKSKAKRGTPSSPP